jgi:hypothetical protein
MCGERQEPRLLLGQGLGHALLAVAGHRPRMGDLSDPLSELGVEIRHRAERAGGEARVAEEADEALDPALGESSRLLPMQVMRGPLSV